jgi:hypothetical protein
VFVQGAAGHVRGKLCESDADECVVVEPKAVKSRFGTSGSGAALTTAGARRGTVLRRPMAGSRSYRMGLWLNPHEQAFEPTTA